MIHQLGSSTYTPPDCPEVTIEFYFELGTDTEIEITNIMVNGDYVSEKLFDYLMESAGEKWEEQILNSHTCPEWVRA